MKLDKKNKTVTFDVFKFDELDSDSKDNAVRHYLNRLEDDDYEKYRNITGLEVRKHLSVSEYYFLDDGTEVNEIKNALLDW